MLRKKKPATANQNVRLNESQNACEADESDKAEAQDESTESSKKKDPKDAVIEELQDRVKRQMAEFDNFRKRTEKEKAAMYEIGAKDIIEKILPVVDNFERGLATIPEDDKATPVAEGMDKIYRQLTKVLEDVGVKEIECLRQRI